MNAVAAMTDLGEAQSRLYRYERKFLVDQLDAHQAEVLIRRHPCLFHSPFPPRFINNLYLDTPEMQYYHDNIDGAMRRRKVRVRWYGQDLGVIRNPTLEIKVKHGLVGTKLQYPLPGFTLDREFRERGFHRILAEGDLPELVKQKLSPLNVVLFNRYYRRYYATSDGRFRLTLDTDLSYAQMRNLRATFMNRQADHLNIIVELKYEPVHDSQANRVSAYFPFSITKSSKYVMGIERVYL